MEKYLQIYRQDQRQEAQHRTALLGAWWGQCISTAPSAVLWGSWGQVCDERGRRGAQGLRAGGNHCAGSARGVLLQGHTRPPATGFISGLSV